MNWIAQLNFFTDRWPTYSWLILGKDAPKSGDQLRKSLNAPLTHGFSDPNFFFFFHVHARSWDTSNIFNIFNWEKKRSRFHNENIQNDDRNEKREKKWLIPNIDRLFTPLIDQQRVPVIKNPQFVPNIRSHHEMYIYIYYKYTGTINMRHSGSGQFSNSFFP